MSLAILAQIAAVIAPVFIVSALGWVWTRFKVPFDSAFVGMVTTQIGAPCLLFATLTQTQVDLAALGVMALACLAAFAAFAVVGILAVKAAGQSLRAFLPSLMFPNCGNMGLPLSQFAFGVEGLAFAAVFFAVQALTQFSIGIAIVMGRFSPAALVRVPMLYAVALAVLVRWFDLPVPEFVRNTVSLLGGLTIPLMLLALGVSLAQLKAEGIGRGLAFSLVRVGLGFAIGVGLAAAFSLEGAARGALILQAAMPVAVFNYLFALRWNVAPAEVAGLVLISTIVSFLSLPAQLWYLLPG